MPAQRSKEIDSLIDQVTEQIDSEHNRRRRDAQPAAIFGLEQPIAEAKLFGFDVSRYFGDPAFYVEQALRLKLWRWAHFPDDDLPLSLDLPAWLGHYPEYTFLGLGVEYTPGGVPNIQTDHPLSRDPDLHLLSPVDFNTSGWMGRCLRWYDDVLRISAGRLNVTFNMTWWRGCLDLAIQLRGYENFVADTVERPAFVHDLLRFLVEQRCRWWEGYYRHFGLKAAPAGVADDWINIPFISPALFADFVLPRYLEIEAFHGGISGVHSCGNQAPVQKYLLELKSLSTFEVSPWTPLLQALANVPPDKSLWVSLHPNDVLVAMPEEMEVRLRFVMQSCRGRRYGIGTSGLTPITPDPADYIRQIRAWTQAAQKVRSEQGE
jgi:hypothetical protein